VVVVLPFEPVTAIITSGSFKRDRTSGNIFKTIFPGKELPLPTSFPMKCNILHVIIAKKSIKFPSLNHHG